MLAFTVVPRSLVQQQKGARDSAVSAAGNSAKLATKDSQRFSGDHEEDYDTISFCSYNLH